MWFIKMLESLSKWSTEENRELLGYLRTQIDIQKSQLDVSMSPESITETLSIQERRKFDYMMEEAFIEIKREVRRIESDRLESDRIDRELIIE